MAGESNFDKFQLMSNIPYSYNILKNNIFVDLSSSDIILERIDAMFTPIKEGSYYKNKIFGFPLSVSFESLFYNKNLVDKHHITIENNLTWIDFINISEEICNNDSTRVSVAANKFRIHQLIIDQYILNYNNIESGDVKFNTREFKDALKIMKSVNNSDTIEHLVPNPLKAIADNQLFLLKANIQNSQEDIFYTSLPCISENQFSPLTIKWAVINPNSNMKELAIKYLEKLPQKDDSHLLSNVLYADKELYGSISDAWYNNYATVMQRNKVSFQLNIYNEVKSILEGYFNDEITIDAATEKIDTKIQMIINE